jgi:CRP/FNR family transcriptional regulator, cyclic AMP receptor protein
MRSPVAGRKRPSFDPHRFLATLRARGRLLVCPKGDAIYAQGDAADAIFFVQKGKVRITVVSHAGKERTLVLVSEGSFFGEGSLAGQTRRTGSAAAMTNCELLRVDKAQMLEALQRERPLADLFVASLLARNIRSEEDLVDLLFNSSERRLARVLLQLAQFGQDGVPQAAVPKISQQTLADMVGTTRSRVSFFMNRFRRMGFVQYAGGQNSTSLKVHSSLLSFVLHDSNARAKRTRSPLREDPAESRARSGRRRRSTSDEDP